MRLLPATAATTAAAPECFSMLARSNNSKHSNNSSNSCISNILSQIHMVLIAMTAATLLALALRDGNTLLLLLWLPLLLLGILSKLPIGSQRQQQQQQSVNVSQQYNHAYLPKPNTAKVRTLQQQQQHVQQQQQEQPQQQQQQPNNEKSINTAQTMSLPLPSANGLSKSLWICKNLHALYFRLLLSSICYLCSMQQPHKAKLKVRHATGQQQKQEKDRGKTIPYEGQALPLSRELSRPVATLGASTASRSFSQAVEQLNLAKV
ncbi:hypothetical protein ACLKA6_004254 [Drosophila palustris]